MYINELNHNLNAMFNIKLQILNMDDKTNIRPTQRPTCFPGHYTICIYNKSRIPTTYTTITKSFFPKRH